MQSHVAGRYEVSDVCSKSRDSVGWTALAILGVAELMYSGAARSQSMPADVLFRNGYIYTVDAKNSCLLYTSPSPRD